MIKLDLNINPDEIVPDRDRYDQEITNSLQQISDRIPEHKEIDFIKRLWKYFKPKLWTQQGRKCAFCEKSIVMDDAHVEHFRPKSEVRDGDNKVLTREAYWWLAYDHKNYVVSCGVCNSQKGNYFPILNNGQRVTATGLENTISLTEEGNLGEERPYLVNPRFIDPEPHLSYSYTPSQVTPMVHLREAEKDDVGKNTISILDLNRTRKNEKIFKDNLPGNRGFVLSRFKNDIKIYENQKNKIFEYRTVCVDFPNPDLQVSIDTLQLKIERREEVIYASYLSSKAEFAGMCRFWLRNGTELEQDFLEIAKRVFQQEISAPA